MQAIPSVLITCSSVVRQQMPFASSIACRVESPSDSFVQLVQYNRRGRFLLWRLFCQCHPSCLASRRLACTSKLVHSGTWLQGMQARDFSTLYRTYFYMFALVHGFRLGNERDLLNMVQFRDIESYQNELHFEKESPPVSKHG